MIGRRKGQAEPKAPRSKPVRAAKTERPARRSLLARLRPSPRRTPADYGEVALLARYRRIRTSRPAKIALYLALAVATGIWGLMFGLTAPFKVMEMIAPLALLALVIIWILPTGEYAPTGIMEPFYLAFFAALVLWPNYIALALPHLPWFTLLRIFATPLILALLISLSVSRNFRQEIGEKMNADRLLWQMFAGFVAIQTLSLVFTSRPADSINKWIVFQTNCTAIFVVSCYLFTFPGFARRWVRMLVALCYAVCFLALWESAIDALPWGEHIPDIFRIDGDIYDSMLQGAMRSAVGVRRVQSVSTTPLGLAELLGMAAPFAVYFFVQSRSIWARLIGAAYLPLALYIILVADSRLGIVALMGSVVFYALVWALMEWRRDQRSLIAPALVLAYPAILAATVVASFVVGALRNRVWGTGAQQASSQAREAQWDMAIPKLISHPWGYGIGEASKVVGFVNPAGRGSLDSYYISILMDFGVVGFILFYGMFLRALWTSGQTIIRNRAQDELAVLLPLAVALLNFVIVKSVFSQDASHPLAFMMLGGVVGLSYRAQQIEKAEAQAPATPSITRR